MPRVAGVVGLEPKERFSYNLLASHPSQAGAITSSAIKRTYEEVAGIVSGVRLLGR